MGSVVVFNGDPRAQDVLRADFNSGSAPFITATTSTAAVTVVDEMYELRALTAPERPISSFAWFTRSSSHVDISVDIVTMKSASAQTAVGVACEDAPRANAHGYVFLVSEVGYTLMRSDQPDGTVLQSSTAAPTAALGGHRIRISCDPSAGPVQIHGYVDGIEKIAAVDPGGFGTYRAVELWFAPLGNGDFVRFDNVAASTPG